MIDVWRELFPWHSQSTGISLIRARSQQESDLRRHPDHHALKALAIRQKKIHIVGTPELKIDGTPVYIDVEGLPDRQLYHLVGLRFKTANGFVQRSLWAGDIRAENELWNGFFSRDH